MRKPEREVEYDVVCVVKSRREAEIRNVCAVCDRGQSAEGVEEWTASGATWKGSRAWVQVEEPYDSDVKRISYCKRGRKVVQFLC